MRFILCDDDREMLDVLKAHTQQWLSEHRLEAELLTFSSSTELLEQYAPRQDDIAVLDIIMPGMNGLEVAKRLRTSNSDFSLIFLTSSKDFALPAYEVHPYGYLLKPADYEGFSQLLDSLYQKLCQFIVLKSGNDMCSILI